MLGTRGEPATSRALKKLVRKAKVKRRKRNQFEGGDAAASLLALADRLESLRELEDFGA